MLQRHRLTVAFCTAYLIICPPRLRQDFILFFQSFFFPKLLFFACLIRSFNHFTSFFSSFFAWQALEGAKETAGVYKNDRGQPSWLCKLTSGFKMAPQRWCNISWGRPWLSGYMCEKAGGHNQEKKTGESFSCSAGIFKLDNQNPEHKLLWLTNTEEHKCCCIHTNHSHISPSAGDAFRLSGRSDLSVPVFVEPAPRCVKEELTSECDELQLSAATLMTRWRLSEQTGK